MKAKKLSEQTTAKKAISLKGRIYGKTKARHERDIGTRLPCGLIIIFISHLMIPI